MSRCRSDSKPRRTSPAFSNATRGSHRARGASPAAFQQTRAKQFSAMNTAPPTGNVATAYSCADKESTEQAERVLLALVSAGDRCAMANLYGLYFTRLGNFFRHLTAHSDLVEELINDTMVEVWKEGTSIGASASVSLAIMGLAYSRGQRRFAEARTTQPHAQPAIQGADHDRALPAISHTPTNPQDFLLKLPFEERAVLHLVYASGHSRRDVADIMNMSCECIDVLLGDARRRPWQ
jgi:DNA-directed RNA polymerase specialized sigma24 family protein